MGIGMDIMDNRILYKSNRCKYCGDIFISTCRTACLKCIQAKVKEDISKINSQTCANLNVSICPDCGKIFNHMFQDMQCADCFLHTYLGIVPIKSMEQGCDKVVRQPCFHLICPTCYCYFISYIPNTQCCACISNVH